MMRSVPIVLHIIIDIVSYLDIFLLARSCSLRYTFVVMVARRVKGERRQGERTRR
ncbi:hypothetical protein PAXRUDRAFT_688937 [Paxillus rubicundulus Ve08.2h10]|uniref:Uncharacterized protein n=1 Tax=Paxillus rubicundulus Ve08.2h10 TaxID=930991 RepID=A0A0D0DTJ7_9AGAM|nr:hypothetical protein PAXRUDRAFT_688937 [Paxillus rubicundulus Ve08.2h10]